MSAEMLRDLARAKAVFQLRAIEAIIRTGEAQGIEAQRAETVEQGSVHESPVAESDAPNTPSDPSPPYQEDSDA